MYTFNSEDYVWIMSYWKIDGFEINIYTQDGDATGMKPAKYIEFTHPSYSYFIITNGRGIQVPVYVYKITDQMLYGGTIYPKISSSS